MVKVWGIVRHVIENPDGVAKMLQERRQVLGGDQILPHLEKARRRLTELKDREGRILDLYLGSDIDREQDDRHPRRLDALVRVRLTGPVMRSHRPMSSYVGSGL